jgi:DNA-3-methyladenine glycosylase
VLLPRETFARGAVEVAPALLGCVIEHETAEGLVAVALTEVEAYHGQADPASHAYRGRTARNAVMFGPPGHAYVYFTYGMHFCANLVCLPEGTASAVLLRAGRVIAGEALARARRTAPGPGGRDLARGPARLCQALAITRALDGADVCDPASPLRVRWPTPEEVRLAVGGRAAAGAVDAGAVTPGTVDAGTVTPGTVDGGVVDVGAVPAAAAAPGAVDAGEMDAGTVTAREINAKAVAAGAVAPGEAGPGPGHAALADATISHGPRVGVSAAGDRPWRFWITGDPTVSVYRPHVARRARPKPVSERARNDGTIPL